jgi:flagellar biogenesis protein FliO
VGHELVENREARPEPRPVQESPNIFMNAFTTFLVLLVLLAGVWLWSRKRTPAVRQGAFREYGSHSLGYGAQVRIVEISNEVWVLGVTANSVNLLHRYAKEEWTEQQPPQTGGENTFYNLFKGRQ